MLSSLLDEPLTPRQQVNVEGLQVTSLKRIDDELWCCHDAGITVYSFDLKQLRSIKVDGRRAVHSAASLDVNTVIIATKQGLSTFKKQGLQIHFTAPNINVGVQPPFQNWSRGL